MTHYDFSSHKCDHNEVKLSYGKGILRGLSGPAHIDMLDAEGVEDAVKNLHIFLDAGSTPKGMIYTNDPDVLNGVPTLPLNRIIAFAVVDRDVPEYHSEFQTLVDIIKAELDIGNTVSVSCIGGHGRTGTVLAVIHGLYTKSQTPIQDIRNIYCKRAVESYDQTAFIHEFLDIPVPAYIPQMCSKCKLNPQQQLDTKKWDSWCQPCNEALQKKQDAWKAGFEVKSQTSEVVPSTPTVHASANFIKEYCTLCKVRTRIIGADLCLTCFYSQEENASNANLLDKIKGKGKEEKVTISPNKPEGLSKNRWKRILRWLTGSAYPLDKEYVVDKKDLAGIIGADHVLHFVPKPPPVRGLTIEESARFHRLNNVSLMKMTNVEFADWKGLRDKRLQFEAGLGGGNEI